MYTHLPKTPPHSLLTLRSHVVHDDTSRAYTHLSLTCRKQHTIPSSSPTSHPHPKSGTSLSRTKIHESFLVLYCFKLTHLLFGKSMQSRSITITVCLKQWPLPEEKSSTVCFSKMCYFVYTLPEYTKFYIIHNKKNLQTELLCMEAHLWQEKKKKEKEKYWEWQKVKLNKVKNVHKCQIL